MDHPRLLRFFILSAGVFAIELFVFNFRHWTFPDNSKMTCALVEMGSGYMDNGDGNYTIIDENSEITVTNADCNLETSWIDIAVLNRQEDEIKPVRIRQLVTDESHRLYYALPERELWENEERSNYMAYHLYGRCTGLKIIPDLSIGQTISFQMTLNPEIPLFFSWERVCLLFLLAAAVYALRPASILHCSFYIQLRPKEKITLVIAFFLMHMALFWGLVNVNPYFQQERGDNQKQYQELAEALEKGTFSLLEEPPETLILMENPYDYDYRGQVMSRNGEEYKWDHAYFGGKYYVYFGVVPAVLLYLPYYMLTGEHLHNYILIFVLALLFLAGILGTVHELIKKWFPKTSLAVWFLITELLLTGSGIIYMAKRPDLYTVPILAGLAFGMLGLWCFLRAKKDGGIRYWYVAAGSLFTALTAGCRPQLFVFVFLSLVLSGNWLPLAKGGLLSIERIKREGAVLLCYVLPMLSVAALLMYYNRSRFGSVFDFGANYNLTFNDMRRRGWEWERLPLGIFAYLLQPVKFITRFPFMEAVYYDSQYMGVTIQEATYGGIFMTHFFAWAGLLPVLFHRQIKKSGKIPWMFSIVCLLLSGVVLLVDTNMSGILQRYFGDFSIFIMLSAALSVLLAFRHERIAGNIWERVMIWGLIICLLAEVGYQGMLFFLDTGEALQDLRPDLYSHFKYLAAFWL